MQAHRLVQHGAADDRSQGPKSPELTESRTYNSSDGANRALQNKTPAMGEEAKMMSASDAAQIMAQKRAKTPQL